MACIRSGTATLVVALVSLIINAATSLVLLASSITTAIFHTSILAIVYGPEVGVEEGEEMLILVALVGSVPVGIAAFASILVLLERPHTAPSTRHLGLWLASHGVTVFLHTTAAILISLIAAKVNWPCTAIVATLVLLACTNLALWPVVYRHRRAQAQTRGARLDQLTAYLTTDLTTDLTADLREHYGSSTAAF